jgi:hypothetical protein
LNASDIVNLRMRRQRLWGPPAGSPEVVVKALGAMQAQEFVPATWSIGQRCGAGQGVVTEAFSTGAILRTHVLRPTWHFAHRDDLRWLLSATASRVERLNAPMYRQLGLDDATLDAGNAVLAQALRGGRHLTRRELADRLAAAGVDASGLRLGYIMMRAELDAVVCSGAPRGKQQTYALFDERVPDRSTLPFEEAVAELARRFFTSRGPATVKDCAKWASLTLAQVRVGLEAIAPELDTINVDGRTYWLASDTGVPPPPSPQVDLVQGYDECVMGYGESRDVLLSKLDRSPAGQAAPLLLHAILIDGFLIGHWRYATRANVVRVETQLHRRLGRAETSALDVAVERLGAFFGMPASRA